MFQIIYQIFDYVVFAVSGMKKSNAEATAAKDGYIAASTDLSDKYWIALDGIHADTEEKKMQIEKTNNVLLILFVILIIFIISKILFRWK